MTMKPLEGRIMNNESTNLVTQVEDYLKQYITFSDESFVMPCALWAIATHCWSTFDAFPYLVITAYTKRAGKSTLKDILLPIVRNGKSFSVSSPAAMFRSLELTENHTQEDFNSMFIEECEQLENDQHPAREFLNKGYEKGDIITKWSGSEVKDFECYCPKAFILIGDPYNTLKDRCIMVIMKRRPVVASLKAPRIRREIKLVEAQNLHNTIKSQIAYHLPDIHSLYMSGEILSSFRDREEQLWQPLFVIAKILCPDRMEELTRCSMDVSMEKQAQPRRCTGDEWEAAERQADDEEARVILLNDLLALLDGKEYIGSNDAIDKLHAIPAGQWRKFRGRGLTVNDMGFLLDALNVHPRGIRVKSGKATKQAFLRGYKRSDIHAAALLAGLIES